MEIKEIIENIDLIFGPIARIIGYITTIGGIISLIVCFIINLYKNRKLKLNKDDGYYYRWKDKYPYCPECYEHKDLKAKIIKDKCVECGKIYKYPEVIIEISPKRLSKADIIIQRTKH